MEEWRAYISLSSDQRALERLLSAEDLTLYDAAAKTRADSAVPALSRTHGENV
jgi:hypothetical protein